MKRVREISGTEAQLRAELTATRKIERALDAIPVHRRVDVLLRIYDELALVKDAQPQAQPANGPGLE